jgi:hypothetical protein
MEPDTMEIIMSTEVYAEVCERVEDWKQAQIRAGKWEHLKGPGAPQP